MGENVIQVHRSKKKTVNCTVSGIADLTGYTATMTVKKNILDASATFTKAGSINGLVCSFVLLPTDTDITEGMYVYDIVIDDGGTDVHAVTQDELKILQSVSN